MSDTSKPEKLDTDRPRGRSCMWIGGIGCGILLLLAIVTAVWVSTYWPSIAKYWLEEITDVLAKQMNAPDDARLAVREQINRIHELHEQGEVSINDLGVFLESMQGQPVIKPLRLWFVYDGTIADSELTAEEKEKAKITLRRSIDGFVRGLVSEAQSDRLMQHFLSDDGIYRPPSDEDLRELLSALDTTMDELGITADAPEHDFIRELNKGVDAAIEEVKRRQEETK